MPVKDSPARPGHRRTVSLNYTKGYLTAHEGNSRAPSSVEKTDYAYVHLSSTSTTKTSSRIMTSVRKSIGSFPKKRGPESLKPTDYGMISTPAERTLPTSTRYRDYTPSRPTIEQIAMGLHTSRTPHLRHLSSSPPPNSHSRRSASPLVLPPPPARSSLKKPASTPATLADNGPASASSSTLASTHTPMSKPLITPMSSIKVRMARFLPRSRISSAPPSVLSSSTSSPRTSLEIQNPKKAVRFSVSTEA
ncbi:hypothetical protein DXG01_003319 [Tephrocybe rancida]|nr:hypothetical protein DXG01_003319 [Tephrocybe rancida]